MVCGNSLHGMENTTIQYEEQNLIGWPCTAELENEFGDDVEMVGVATPNVSGYLEVDVNGRLVHSKKNGDGYIDSEAKLQKIIRAVEDAL
ncbi:unnamed protein product [Clavelina lepadiformis]|uniref:Selenoprotein W n=1 Tax=Clavelina lepadiformis TaxID=159417 RepID=A0ABP0FLQ6_CLALP